MPPKTKPPLPPFRGPAAAARFVDAYITGLRQHLPTRHLQQLDRVPGARTSHLHQLQTRHPAVPTELLRLLERSNGTISYAAATTTTSTTTTNNNNNNSNNNSKTTAMAMSEAVWLKKRTITAEGVAFTKNENTLPDTMLDDARRGGRPSPPAATAAAAACSSGNSNSTDSSPSRVVGFPAGRDPTQKLGTTTTGPSPSSSFLLMSGAGVVNTPPHSTSAASSSSSNASRADTVVVAETSMPVRPAATPKHSNSTTISSSSSSRSSSSSGVGVGVGYQQERVVVPMFGTPPFAFALRTAEEMSNTADSLPFTRVQQLPPQPTTSTSLLTGQITTATASPVASTALASGMKPRGRSVGAVKAVNSIVVGGESSVASASVLRGNAVAQQIVTGGQPAGKGKKGPRGKITAAANHNNSSSSGGNSNSNAKLVTTLRWRSRFSQGADLHVGGGVVLSHATANGANVGQLAKPQSLTATTSAGVEFPSTPTTSRTMHPSFSDIPRTPCRSPMTAAAPNVTVSVGSKPVQYLPSLSIASLFSDFTVQSVAPSGWDTVDAALAKKMRRHHHHHHLRRRHGLAARLAAAAPSSSMRLFLKKDKPTLTKSASATKMNPSDPSGARIHGKKAAAGGSALQGGPSATVTVAGAPVSMTRRLQLFLRDIFFLPTRASNPTAVSACTTGSALAAASAPPLKRPILHPRKPKSLLLLDTRIDPMQSMDQWIMFGESLSDVHPTASTHPPPHATNLNAPHRSSSELPGLPVQRLHSSTGQHGSAPTRRLGFFASLFGRHHTQKASSILSRHKKTTIAPATAPAARGSPPHEMEAAPGQTSSTFGEAPATTPAVKPRRTFHYAYPKSRLFLDFTPNMAEGGTVGQVVRVTWIEGERAASSGACGKGVPPPHHNNNGGGEIPGVREVADEPEEFRVIAEFRVLAPDFGTYLKQIMLDEYDFMEEITLAEEVEEAAASKLKHKSSTTATAVAGAGKILAPAGGGGAATTTAAVGRSPSPSTSTSSSTSDSPNGSMVSSASAEADVMQTQTAAIHSPHHHSGGGVHGAGDPATTPTAESKHLTEGLRVAATVVSAAAMTTKETDKDDRKAPIMPVESDGAGHGVTAREINPHGAAGAGARSIPRSTPSQSSSAAPASSPVWTSSRLAVAPEESGSEEDDDEEDEELEEDEEDLEDEDLVLQAMIKT